MEAISRWLFEDAPNDMAMLGNIPLSPNPAFIDPDYMLNLTHAVVEANPERTIFGGGTDPVARAERHS